MTPSTIIGLAPTGSLEAALARGDDDALAALEAVHESGLIAFLVLGSERLIGAPQHGRRTEPASVAAARHRRFPAWGFLISTVPAIDHPYNLARRVSTVDHFSGGRAGAIIGRPADTSTAEDHRSWPVGAATDAELLADAGQALRELWGSWPRETLVGDVTSGVFARTAPIRRIDHRGVFSIDGPLNAPSSVQGEPVLAWWLDDAADLEAATRVADLLIVDPDVGQAVTSRQRALATDEPAPLVFIRQSVGDAIESAADDITTGDGLIAEVSEVFELRDLLRGVLTAGGLSLGKPRTLRAALGLSARTVDLSDRAAAIYDLPATERPRPTNDRSTFE